MDKGSVQKVEIAGAIFGTGLGTLLHFTYAWSGKILLVGLFSAVNESVWEHTKLIYFPVILYLVVEFFFFDNHDRLPVAKLCEVLFGILFIITFFYTYSGMLGIESLAVDIISFVVAVVLGKYISYRIIMSDQPARINKAVAVISLIAIFGFFMITTLSPPKIPLFREQNTGTYGINGK